MRVVRGKLLELYQTQKNPQNTKAMLLEIKKCQSELLDIYLELHRKYRKGFRF
jgi:hypothetical protein